MLTFDVKYRSHFQTTDINEIKIKQEQSTLTSKSIALQLHSHKNRTLFIQQINICKGHI